jgi:hypothetical protein
MPIISGGQIIEGGMRGYSSTGAPTAGTTEVQTITFGGTPTGGTFTITFGAFTTAAITWVNVNATLVSNIDTALEALPNIGTGGITTAVGTMTAGIGTITMTFAGNNAVRAQSLMVATSSLTGTAPTVAITETTPGVNASGAGAAIGAMLVRDNGVLYINTGTAVAPTWTVVGTQT